MFVDTGCRTTMDVMEYTDWPVILSHTNPKALCAHGRNITDEQIRACARTGGIVGIVGFSRFLGEGRADTELLADHVKYLIDLAGSRHVAARVGRLIASRSIGTYCDFRVTREAT
jgi:membrane dipeptidase